MAINLSFLGILSLLSFENLEDTEISSNPEILLADSLTYVSTSSPTVFTSGPTAIMPTVSESIITHTYNNVNYSGPITGNYSDIFYAHGTAHDKYNRSSVFMVQTSNLKIASWMHNYRSRSYETAFMIEGQLTSTFPTGLVSYSGEYVEHSTSYSEKPWFVPVTIEVNFSKGTVEGWDRSRNDVLRIEGNLRGAVIEGQIFSPSGASDFIGGLYGANAIEISGAFANGGRGGMLFAEFDPARTDFIN